MLSSMNLLFARRRSREVVAVLKVGWKRLLLLDDSRDVHDMLELCVLDFCVRAHHQRRGVGRKLFDSMLAYERRRPWELPIDNPSAKMRSFMRRHYDLNTELDTIPQLNRFTVFRGFPFECQTRMSDRERSDSCERCAKEHSGGGSDVITRGLHEGDGHHQQENHDRCRRWTADAIYGQRTPRHSSEHRGYESSAFHRSYSSDNSEKDNPFWCCNQEYSRRMIRPSRNGHFRMGEHDLRTVVPRSTSCSSWRVFGLEGPGGLSHQIS
ncbi:alpha-tubulin N-acetyltransferase 2-like [Tropilaelaps mercedesae]|uniref:Alpha-tubulin N-acetyltransferase 2-like n=1 Tax=Tropilaelaps mercedesae TaxID=418985 RepID=A0A1V9X5P5_9ACAR|nr:alpha-tubulin N-acetyltransferase 2-like [Tropilaelaps mercedesae]